MPRDPLVSGAEHGRGGRGLVLVIDEDPDFGSLLADYLAATGWIVTKAAAAPDHAAPADLASVVLVLRPPAFDGLAGVRALRTASPTLPIIAVASFGDALLGARARRLGATLVLERPFDLEDLARSLDRCASGAVLS